MGRVLVGTASWTNRSLLESGWHPPTATTPEERLDHYAAKFPLVEVDATYYHPPALRTTELWRDRIPGTRRLHRRARPRPWRQPRRHTGPALGRCHQTQSRASALVRGPGRRVAPERLRLWTTGAGQWPNHGVQGVLDADLGECDWGDPTEHVHRPVERRHRDPAHAGQPRCRGSRLT
ncbi:DUF72 domain-containing protein [Nonomuraea sp. NPDC001699]